MLILVDQLNMSIEKPPYLIAEAGPSAADGIHAQLAMNSESERPRTNSRLWVRTASVETQANNKRGRLP